MNTDTGAVYPDYDLDASSLYPEFFDSADAPPLSRERADELKAEVEGLEDDELVHLAGSPEKVAEAIEALKQHAKSKGTYDPKPIETRGGRTPRTPHAGHRGFLATDDVVGLPCHCNSVTPNR